MQHCNNNDAYSSWLMVHSNYLFELKTSTCLFYHEL